MMEYFVNKNLYCTSKNDLNEVNGIGVDDEDGEEIIET